MSVTGNGPGEPLRVGVPIADLTAGLFGIIGVLAALHERARSGRGQRVETSLLAGQIAIHAFQGTRYLVADEVPEPTGNHHPTVAPYGSFRAADGQIILAVGNEVTWRRFAELLDIPPDLAPFAGNQSRVAHRDELQELIEQRLGERNVAEWIKVFADHGVPAGEVKTLDRVYASEQVRDQGLVVEVAHSTLGEISLPGRPLRFDGSPLRGRAGARRAFRRGTRALPGCGPGIAACRVTSARPGALPPRDRGRSTTAAARPSGVGIDEALGGLMPIQDTARHQQPACS